MILFQYTHLASCTSYCRLHVVYFFIIMACLTCALVLAAKKKDPRKYDEHYDIFRGCCEALSFFMIAYNGVAEINQLKM